MSSSLLKCFPKNFKRPEEMNSIKNNLKPYKKLYICLDRDATTKAYDIAKDLRSSGFDNVVVKPLEDDLKYFNTEQIEEIFYDRKTNA